MNYEVEVRDPASLSASELENCCAILKCGGAVNPQTAKTEIPRAIVFVGSRFGSEIVGVGAIKRSRPNYASDKAKKSQFDFDRKTLELGYVAVDTNHQGQYLSDCIVEELLSSYSGKLFATTDHGGMKKALEKAGFKQKGFEWQGKRGKLSLWLRD